MKYYSVGILCVLTFVVITIFQFGCNDPEIVKPAYNPTPYLFDQSIPERDFAKFIPVDNPMTKEGTELGKDLFSNTILSYDGTVSCSRCHDPENAFCTRDVRFNTGFNGAIMSRNTMSLVNELFNQSIYNDGTQHIGWDGNPVTIEKSIISSVENPDEFHENWDHVISKLEKAGYNDRFYAAFGEDKITKEQVAKAIAQFVRSNISINSKFDRAYYFKDTTARFTPLESYGFQLFNSEKADCFHCHRLGLFSDNRVHNNGLDASPEMGYFAYSGSTNDIGKFKTVTLRNIEITAPYMHDGRFETLEEVMDFYSGGVHQNSPNLDPNMNHSGSQVILNEEEKIAVIAFLKTLTDEKYKGK